MSVRSLGGALALGLLGTLTLHPAPAEAACAMRTPFLATGADGPPAAPDRVGYLFLPSYGAVPEVISPDGPLQVEKLDESGAYRVYRVQATGPRPVSGRWAVELRDANGEISPLVGQLQDPGPDPHAGSGVRAAPARVVQVRSSVYAWACSHEEAQFLVPSAAAPAYRVIWALSAEAYRQGRVQSVVLPRHSGMAYHQGRNMPGVELPLGHVSCLGQTLAWPAVGGRRLPLHVGVIPLFSDGSEGPRPPEPTLLLPPRAPAVALPAAPAASTSSPRTATLGPALPAPGPLRQLLEGAAGFLTGWGLVQLVVRLRRRWARATLAAVVAMLAVPAAQAEAKCAFPSGHVTSAVGGQKPAVVYLFEPSRQGMPAATSPDGPIEVRQVSESDAFRVFRIAPAAPERRLGRWRVTLRRPGHEGPVRLVLDNRTLGISPRGERSAAARVIDVMRNLHSWTCSYSEAQVLVPSIEAPAYRVVWATSAQAYRQGDVQSLVLPHDVGELYGRGGSEKVGLQLGHVSCLGETLKWPTVAGRQVPIHVGVIPLFSDGSEGPRPLEPTLVPPPRTPAAETVAPAPASPAAIGVPAAVSAPVTPAPTPVRGPVVRPVPFTAGLLWLLEGISGFLTGWLLAFAVTHALRRRRAPLLAVLALVALPAAQARAECAAARAVIVADQGAAVAFLVDPSHKIDVAAFKTAFTRSGLPTYGDPVEVGLVGESPAFRIYRIGPVDAHRGRRRWPVFIRVAERLGQERLLVSPPLTRAQRASIPTEIGKVTPSVFHWTCSYSEAQLLEPSVMAPAYRVLWATSEEAYRRGQVQSLVLPRSTAELFGRPFGPRDRPSLPLGHVSCLGETLRWPTIGGRQVPIHVGVVPLFADGTEGPVPPEPTLIPPPRAPEPIPVAKASPPLPAPPVVAAPSLPAPLLRTATPAAHPRRQLVEGTAGFLTGFALVHLATHLRRRRVPAPIHPG